MSDDYGNSLRDSWDPIGYQRTKDLHKEMEKLKRIVSIYEQDLKSIVNISKDRCKNLAQASLDQAQAILSEPP